MFYEFYIYNTLQPTLYVGLFLDRGFGCIATDIICCVIKNNFLENQSFQPSPSLKIILSVKSCSPSAFVPSLIHFRHSFDCLEFQIFDFFSTFFRTFDRPGDASQKQGLKTLVALGALACKKSYQLDGNARNFELNDNQEKKCFFYFIFLYIIQFLIIVQSASASEIFFKLGTQTQAVVKIFGALSVRKKFRALEP